MTIKELIESGINIFDFDYMFYNHDIGAKQVFENKFIDQFYYYEIGFDDVDKFKHFLRTKLITSYPYYYQLYQTELRCAEIDFMLNKDLKETIKKEIKNQADNIKTSTTTGTVTNEEIKTGNNVSAREGENTTTDNINATMTDEYTESNDNTIKESNIANGLSSTEIQKGYLTGMQDTTANNSYNLTEENSATNSSTLNLNESTTNTINENQTGTVTNDITQTDSNKIDETQAETTELISQGNIGVTSSAELLEKWRKVILNIDMMLLNELSNLFLKIY